jgi:hypothetical protein
MPKALTIEEKIERATQVRTAGERVTSERKRNAFNGTEGKLTVEHKIEGYHLHILNDTPGRIQQALDGGYEFVKPSELLSVKENVTSRNTDVGDKVRFLVNPSAKEGEQYAYLMKIKQEWFDEDQNALQEKNNQTDEAIRSGRNLKGSSEGFYTPREGIQYKN